MADETGGEARARRLLRRVKRGRRWSFIGRLVLRGLDAERELTKAAVAGDMAALRALTGSGPRPDPRFNRVWEHLLSTSGAYADLRGHLERNLGYPDLPVSSHASEYLAVVMLRPAEDELTADMRPVVAVAAALSGHPLADIARRKILAVGDQDVIDDVCEVAGIVSGLADFCLEHELTPSHPVGLASFWLSISRYERYRAADPDGSLALSAYSAADDKTRARLRSAAIGGGLFDLLRRMVEGHDEVATLLDAKHFAELSAALVRHGRWPELWELVTELPAAEAVQQSRRFPERWRPGSAADHRLYAALRSAPEDLVSAAAADPILLTTIRFEHDVLRVGLGRSRAAVFSRSADQRLRSVDVYALPGGELLGHHAYEGGPDPGLAVPCGDEDGTVVAGDETGLWCFTRDDRVPLDAAPVRYLVATAGGWAAISASDLLIGSAGGQLRRRVQLDDLGLHPAAVTCTVSVDGARLALADHWRLMVLDHDGRLLCSTTLDETDRERPWAVQSLGLLGDTLITAYRRSNRSRTRHVGSTNDESWAWDDVEINSYWNLACWSISPDGHLTHARRSFTLGEETASFTYSADPLERPSWHHPGRELFLGPNVEHTEHPKSGSKPVTLDMHDQLWLHELPSFPARLLAVGHHGELTLVDFGSFQAEKLPNIPGSYDTRPSVVPGTSLLAMAPPTRGDLKLYDMRRGAVLAPLNRPMPELQRTDLDAVRALPGYEDDPCVRLLRACLEHRWPD